jgi:hypothetical protein
MSDNFWDTVQLPNPVPENYREMVAINSIPLFETQIISEMVELAEDMMISPGSEVWRNAMTHVPRGFTPGNDTIERHFIKQLDDGFVTNAWNLRSNEHYDTYQNMSGNTINRFKRIVELGGGCGDFCRFVRDMGFEGEYVIWDLPMVSRIQQVALADLDVYFTHHVPKPAPQTLFVATWSLSETPLEFRDYMVKKLNPNNYLICYQHEFEDFSNTDYFSTWSGRQALMYDQKSSYLCQ